MMSQLTDGQAAEPIKLYTSNWCGDCLRAKKVMESMKVQFTEINIMDQPDAAEMVEKLNGGYRSVPTILFPDGSVLTEPSNAELVAKLRNASNSLN